MCAVQAGVPVVEKIRWLDQELSHLQCPYPISHIEFTFAGDAGEPASRDAKSRPERSSASSIQAGLSMLSIPSTTELPAGADALAGMVVARQPLWPSVGCAVVQFISEKAMKKTLSRYQVLKWRAMEVSYRPCTEEDIRALWWVGIAGCPPELAPALRQVRRLNQTQI